MESLEKGNNEITSVEQFFATDFDVEAYSRAIIDGGKAVADELQQLKLNMNELDRQLKSQVFVLVAFCGYFFCMRKKNEFFFQITHHHGKLLNQATSIESLEGILTGLRQHIETLQSASDRVASRVGDAFSKAQLRTTQLERLHETCNIVRSVIRIFYLSNRLQPYADSDTLPVKELPKIAGHLQELREITEETADLSGIETVAKDLALIPKLQKSVVNTAKQVLLQGLKMHNQAQIGTALQTYYHLKSLPSQIDRLL